MYDFLKYEIVEHQVGLLTISNPKALNALNASVIRELGDFISKLEQELAGTNEGRIAVLVITGEGNSFVAGADIGAMEQMSREEAFAFSGKAVRVFRQIECLPIPVIAAVNGYALGGGCELAMACDIRYAAERALVGQPEVSLGITPGFSGTFRLAKLVGEAVAKEMIYTGKPIKAQEAKEIGLVNKVLPDDQLMEYVLKQCAVICRNSAYAVAQGKYLINGYGDMNTLEALDAEMRSFSSCFEREDQRKRMRAFLEKKK